MTDHDRATPPGQSSGSTSARGTHAGPSSAGGADPTTGSDWRAAWRAARFSDEESGGQSMSGSGGLPHDVFPLSGEAARHGGPTGWLPPDELALAGGSRNGHPPGTGPQAALPTQSASTGSGTSTIDPAVGTAGAGAPNGADGSNDANRLGFRALLTLGLAQARARAAGRIDVEPSARAPAAGSISAPVAAEMAAASIPSIGPRPSPEPVPAQTAVAPATALANPPSISLPATERAAAPAVVIPSGVPAVVPAVAPVPISPLPVHPVSAVPVAVAGASTAVVGRTISAATAASTRPKPAAKPRPPARRPGRIRRAHLKVTRIDPWTVMKISFMLSIAFGIMTIVAVAVVWSMLDAAGVFTSINDTLSSVTGGTDGTSGSGGFDLLKWVALDRVLGFTTLIAVVDVVLITALATLGAFLYNLASALLGGVEVTLVEDQR